MHTDPIADLLTRIRNASSADLKSTNAPYSKIKENILKMLVTKGFIEKFEKTTDDKPELVIILKDNKKLNIRRVSTPGQRIYLKKDKLRITKSGIGISIISTSRGLMTAEEAKKQNIGGEILCEIY